ncbi:MAG: ligase-associated DNA damage response DEXH box helicase [Wenzhouxiangellaceae bacterium]|nr:ligase-associated DNA damage response DEXH box helicase [Wenzhouxiangellaceae bacterium]
MAIEGYFAHRGWPVLNFQRRAWAAYAGGRSGLIHAPTGSGKTLAAWGGAVEEMVEDGANGLNYLWLTPLRALAADTARALDRPLAYSGKPDQVALRTGDTSSYRRKKLLEKPPPALVTTPESLAVMLSYADAPARMSKLRAVFVDEWHELMGSKRGVLLQLCLARLKALNPALKTWGLSATLGNLDEAAATLLGPGIDADIIAGERDRPVALVSLLPESISRFPWAGRVGVHQLKKVVERIEAAESTLLFTNTRSQAEIWFNAIQSVCAWPERVALHHGSIDRALRESAEQGLVDGRLKCVVATASLDLGVDFPTVDQVVQVGSPKGIARLIQRAGRSGHRPDGQARIHCVPTHALEVLELAAAREGLTQGRVEARSPIRLALDVLAQHLVTIALGGGFETETMYREVRGTDAFADLDGRQWQWVIDFITRGGPALKAYPDFQRVVEIDGRMRVPNRRIAMLHRLNIGTITADGALQVRFSKGASLGTIEERFLTRLKPGDRFVFAGRALELVRIRDMTAYVRSARSRKATVPAWVGGRLPLSTLLADGMLALIDDFETGQAPDSPEAVAAAPLLSLQRRVSALPGRERLVVEHGRSREGAHWFVFPFAGRLAHEGLAALVAARIAARRPATFSITVNDYGFELLSAEPVELDEQEWRELLSPRSLQEDILESLNAAGMARSRFRDIARIAGLVQQGYPGRRKATRQLQASSGLVFDVLSDYDPDNLLLAQARREVLEAQLEYRRIERALDRIARQQVVVTRPERFSPLAFPIWADRLRAQLSSEDWQARVNRMLTQLESVA